MKKRFGQKAFFLKAVFVFFRFRGRRSRRDSFLSFLLFDSDASPTLGGDPFSHPSGSSVSRRIRVRPPSAAGRLSPAHRARPPPGRPEARKRSVPNRVHAVVNDWWLASPHGSASNVSLTHGSVESP